MAESVASAHSRNLIFDVKGQAGIKKEQAFNLAH